MATLAPNETISVAFPENIMSFLKRRAERDHLTIQQTLIAIILCVMKKEKFEVAP